MRDALPGQGYSVRELQAFALSQVPTGSVCQHIASIHISSLTPPRPKSEKHADGYPGDTEETFPLVKREMRNIRTRVRWNCDKCETLFKDTETTCSNCGHEKCNECPRQPPMRVKRILDEDTVKSVEERMKSLDVSPQASAA